MNELQRTVSRSDTKPILGSGKGSSCGDVILLSSKLHYSSGRKLMCVANNVVGSNENSAHIKKTARRSVREY